MLLFTNLNEFTIGSQSIAEIFPQMHHEKPIVQESQSCNNCLYLKKDDAIDRTKWRNGVYKLLRNMR